MRVLTQKHTSELGRIDRRSQIMALRSCTLAHPTTTTSSRIRVVPTRPIRQGRMAFQILGRHRSGCIQICDHLPHSLTRRTSPGTKSRDTHKHEIVSVSTPNPCGDPKPPKGTRDRRNSAIVVTNDFYGLSRTDQTLVSTNPTAAGPRDCRAPQSALIVLGFAGCRADRSVSRSSCCVGSCGPRLAWALIRCVLSR